jgi:hypothetical protein
MAQRYGLPNPTRGITSLSRGSKMDIKATNPAAMNKSFSTPAAKVPMTKDIGTTPHRLGVKTQKAKMPKTAFGK